MGQYVPYRMTHLPRLWVENADNYNTSYSHKDVVI